MSKVKIITDSNSGFLQEEGSKLGVEVIPMPFTINDTDYLEEINISQEEFYDLLENDPEIFTSQPPLGVLQDVWEKNLKTHDEIVFIPMSSGLSGTCQSSILLAKDYDGKVQVVDNKRISVTQKESVVEAISLAKEGKSAKEIKEYLESNAKQSSIYIMLDTIKYLKRGGRISPAAAAIGTILKIKPILTSRGGKFEKFAMSLSTAQGKKRMISQIKKEIETEFNEAYENGKVVLSVAHTQNEVEANKFKDEIIKEFPKAVFHFVNPLSLSVSCHIGPGALAIALSVNNTL